MMTITHALQYRCSCSFLTLMELDLQQCITMFVLHSLAPSAHLSEHIRYVHCEMTKSVQEVAMSD